MIRAIFFDFYSVWTPDKFGYYLANAQLNGPEVYKQMYDLMEQYYHGQVDVSIIAETFQTRLGHPDITVETLRLSKDSISPEITNFIRGLHGHFVKVGVFANLGMQENQLLSDFNKDTQLFEVIASPLSLNTTQPLLSQEVFAGALQAIGEPPESTLIVSGNPYILAFAKNFGINTLHFEGLPKLEQTLAQILSSDIPPTTT
jgi:FMN phosphatase YigB (HAD superfamily)